MCWALSQLFDDVDKHGTVGRAPSSPLITLTAHRPCIRFWPYSAQLPGPARGTSNPAAKPTAFQIAPSPPERRTLFTEESTSISRYMSISAISSTKRDPHLGTFCHPAIFKAPNTGSVAASATSLLTSRNSQRTASTNYIQYWGSGFTSVHFHTCCACYVNSKRRKKKVDKDFRTDIQFGKVLSFCPIDPLSHHLTDQRASRIAGLTSPHCFRQFPQSVQCCGQN